jgi:glycosyltransferase involved in cell wall biosynthesis
MKTRTTSTVIVKARNRDACLVIPVYNEAEVIESVIKKLYQHFRYIVCVDDGSRDDSYQKIEKTSAILLRHAVNLGQGGALQTGLEYAKRQLPDVSYFVTFDADGQHRIEDALAMLELLRSGDYDIVLGSRFAGNGNQQQSVPALKRLLLKGGVLFTNRMSGIELTDTHNGLRAFNRWFAERLKITMSDMSHASEIIDTVVQTKARWREIPVTINYTEYSMRKGQSPLNAVNIVFDSVLNRWIR